MRKQVLLVVLAVLLLRLPFLNVALQWDDYNYLAAARYALTDPLHPTHVRYVFQGEWHDMRGHPHPPGASWTLALLLAILGPFREIPFHSAYLSFSFLAALSMLVLARRFSAARAMEATLLFLVAPASAVSGTSFESDMPFLAFWMASVAAFVEAVEERSTSLLALAATAMAAASLFAFQSVVLIPILGFYLWRRCPAWRPGWLTLTVPGLVIAGYQLFERLTGGALPAQVLAGHFQQYGLQRLEMKARNAAALTAQLGFVLCPLLFWVAGARLWWLALPAAIGGFFIDPSPLFWAPFATGVLALGWLWSKRRDHPFLAGWTATFFIAALIIFFAGAARYLLPMAAPAALLAALHFQKRPAVLWAGIAFNAALALSAAFVNAELWNQSRDFAARIARQQPRDSFVSAEWGIRWYLEQAGVKPLTRLMALEPGQRLIESALGGGTPFTTGGGRLALITQTEIRPAIPLRIAGLESKSGYATIAFGLRPFDWNSGVVDRLTVKEVVAVEPTLSWLPMNAPEASTQIIRGVYGLEQNLWRWAARGAVFALKTPAKANAIAAEIFVPDRSPARNFELRLDGVTLTRFHAPAPGLHTVKVAAPPASGSVSRLEIVADAAFTPQGDSRPLSFIVQAVGYQ